MADGSGAHKPVGDEKDPVDAAEQALIRQEWAVAKELWHALACSLPQNKHYRAQLTFARAGELLAAGEVQRAREELERVLRMVPDHAGAAAMMKTTTRGGRISKLLRR